MSEANRKVRERKQSQKAAFPLTPAASPEVLRITLPSDRLAVNSGVPMDILRFDN